MIINPATPEPSFSQETQKGVSLGSPASTESTVGEYYPFGVPDDGQPVSEPDIKFDELRSRYEALMGGGSYGR